LIAFCRSVSWVPPCRRALILVVNANTFFGAIGLSTSIATVACILLIGVWIAALGFAIGARSQDQEEAPEGQAV